MAQYKKCNGEPREITRWQLQFKKGSEKGVYYITYPKNQKQKAMKKAKEFRKGFEGSQWKVKKIKRNVWVQKGKC